MFEFHGDRKRYFDIQRVNSGEYVIPFIEHYHPLKPGSRVLEIGCGEAGVLLPFLERGCEVVGVELDAPRLVMAAEMLRDHIDSGKARFIARDIYEVKAEELGGAFDIIILKDVIEHIHDQPKLMAEMKRFLKKDGCIFFGFPPWQMPFGGHQQVIQHKWLSKLPYYHLLPRFAYKALLQWGKAPVEAMMDIRDTGISIERFERIVRQTGYNVVHKTFFLVNPIYKYKFGWQPRKQVAIVSAVPYLRDFVTSCVYYLIKPVVY